ncbi:hypothetical protein [Flavobacterium gelatinilyticum]|uniref:hypothetical protein n=1 Tax=Flavobacterium gelatinilyticum TaxID=3003260 RepID=UPI0024801FBF|nr:hypothetical protein [Flavobacterium gelatinilyticum]
MKEVKELEKQISEIRYSLILKGTKLNFLKENLTSQNIDEIEGLNIEVNELRKQLSSLQNEIIKLKHRYYVSYEVTFTNTYSNTSQKEIYHEFFYLDKEVDVDFPAVTKSLLDNKLEEFLLELFDLLKNKYDEVSLLVVKKI